MRDAVRTRREERLAQVAAAQHGVFSLAQAEALGYSRADVFRRVQARRIHRVFPQTYHLAGAPRSLEQRAIAAVFWAGPDAVASYDTAAALWGIVRGRPSAVHVTAPRKLGAAPQGVQTHVATIHKRDRGKLRGVPVTSVARTLLDLAATWSEARLLPLVERAALDGLTTAEQVQDVLARNPGRRGSRRLARALDTAGSSALERGVEAILGNSGLPPHEREHPVGPFRLDFAWPSAKVGLEADGRRWHSSRLDFERDRAKANTLTDRGWRVLRATARDLDDPGPFLEALARLLAGG